MFGSLLFIVQAVLVSALVQATYFPKQQQKQQQHVFPSSTLLSLPSKIRGGSPLRFCNESRAMDLFSIDEIELYPKPLYVDDVFEVHLYGTFLKTITNDATWTSLARYGNAPVNETWTQNFCEVVDSIDQPDPRRKQECPPEKGFTPIMMSAWVMPMFIVPGDYYFKFDAVTREGDITYCQDAEIHLEDRDKKMDIY